MDLLKEFDRKISLVDGMLHETGGKFGEWMDNYINSCIEIADRYYQDNRKKKDLLEIIDFHMMQYENAKQWKYYADEIRFLSALKSKIEQFN